MLIGEISHRLGDTVTLRRSVGQALDAYSEVTAENPAVSPLRGLRLLALADAADGNLEGAIRRLRSALRSDRAGDHEFDPEGECLLRLELIVLLKEDAAPGALEETETSCSDDAVWQRPRLLYARVAAQAALGDLDAAIATFELLSQNSRRDAWVGLDPALAAVRADPRTAEALSRLLPL